MIRYFAKRVLLMVPTLFGIVAINFFIVQLAPGGPADTVLAEMRQHEPRNGGAMPGLDPGLRVQLNQQFGFDKPPLTRFVIMLRGYMTFDLGESLFRGQSVRSLIWQRLPVSLSLGLWSTLLVYLVAVPLGIAKAMADGSRFDTLSSLTVLAGFAVPGFLLAVFVLALFGEGGWIPLFPLRGLASSNASGYGWAARIADYAWHMVLPTMAMAAGGFAALTMLTKNAFLEEIGKLYVLTARAKGASERQVLYGHVLRNAILPVIAGLPAAFTAILFSSALIVEIMFSVNGLGLLGYEAALQRDYPVMFGTLYVYTLAGLALRMVGDFLYVLVDPRIDFER